LTTPAVLALEDGTVFRGVSIGAAGTATGEVVFNTSMTGYQEILTDPSYSRQIVTLTNPHIGNTGANSDDLESASIHAAGLVIRELPLQHSSWRGMESLAEFLTRGNVVAIAEIDTRRLTRLLREKGRAGRLHRERRGGGTPGSGDRRGQTLPGSQGHGSRQGRERASSVPVERRHELVARAGTQTQARPAAARRGVRLRSQAQHPAAAVGPRLPHDGRPGADLGRRGDVDAARRRVPVERPRRSGAVHLRDRGHETPAQRRHPRVRHLSRPSAARSRLRRQGR
jgi:hypothetical protein